MLMLSSVFCIPIFAILLIVLTSSLIPVGVDELEIEYCYCRSPGNQRSWVKYFNYTSERKGGANYIWNAKCGLEASGTERYGNHCFAGKCAGDTLPPSDPKYNLDHERFEHCNTFEDGIKICNDGWSYSLDGYKVDDLPGQSRGVQLGWAAGCDCDMSGRECFLEWDDQDKTVDILSDCSEEWRRY